MESAEYLLLSGGGGSSGGDAEFHGRIRVDGRFWVNDKGTFRPRFTSALSLLRPDRSDAQVREFLDWAVETGFNGIRVFGGALPWASNQTPARARERLPFVLEETKKRQLYIELSVLTETGTGYDAHAHLLAMTDICLRYSHVILESANEPWHPTQSEQVHNPDILNDWSNQVVPTSLACALGCGPADEGEAGAQFAGDVNVDYVTAHLDRSRDKWNQVRRVRELELLSGDTKKPVMNNEPIGADEFPQPGRRESDPHFFFCMGVLNRIFEVGGIHHSQHGLDASMPGPTQQKCADAFVRGQTIIPLEDRLQFQNSNVNGTWPQSPIKSHDESQMVRAYSGVTGNRAWTCLVGLNTPNPNLQLQNGWRIVGTVEDRPGVRLLELAR